MSLSDVLTYIIGPSPAWFALGALLEAKLGFVERLLDWIERHHSHHNGRAA